MHAAGIGDCAQDNEIDALVDELDVDELDDDEGVRRVMMQMHKDNGYILPPTLRGDVYTTSYARGACANALAPGDFVHDVLRDGEAADDATPGAAGEFSTDSCWFVQFVHERCMLQASPTCLVLRRN